LNNFNMSMKGNLIEFCENESKLVW